ncbi:unnamed protein product [Callosobruchus maculatus]|uniref:Uncharacterized protein n=1 Tax=Callosobruchus maculatus TaxID=64391 RepID=A0A653BY65_CALMS|nr:unnamed protein product [Callosobruchus maculatus]
MSFGKAKRFNYKEPDLKVSPADYNISSSYDKGYSIPKCPRFRCKQDSEASTSCCKCSRTQDKFERRHNSVHCSTPNSTSPYENPLKSLIEKFNKEDIKNATFHKVPLSEPRCSTRDTSLKKNQNIFGSGSEGFIDDDYHSYTSSEELDSLAKIEEYEFNEVCKQFQKVLDRNIFQSGSKNTDFESLVLAKLDSIENEIKEFKENVDELNKNVRKENHADLQLLSMKDAQNYFGNQLSLVSKNKQSEVRGVIREAIQRLCYDLNKKKREMVKQSKAKVMDLLQEIEKGDADTDVHVKQLCVQVCKDLTRKVNGVLRENEIECYSGASAISGDQEDSFNYENICGILSEHLQQSKNENEGLAMDNLEITLKYEDTKETVNAQTTLISLLYEELETLKKAANKE